jgi:hypothetical protein
VGAPAPLVHRGPATPLAAERARQARIALVGAVTERWAPEQAGPVHENWQLAPPIGPATDLWALGALLYRAVQGYAPYPEDSAAELVQLVCSEPPAFAEECGPLRPVVESLLRQDPTERPDFEELRGWLRSLVRSAPEPEAGEDLVSVPAVEGRLPIVRRKGELVRRRRFLGRGRVKERDAGRHRHKRATDRAEAGFAYADQPGEALTARPAAQEPGAGEAYAGAEPGYDPAADQGLQADLFERAGSDLYDRPGRKGRDRPGGRTGRRPRSLGRTLLVLILLALVYATEFLPKSGQGEGQSVQEAPSVAPSQAGSTQAAGLQGGASGSPQNGAPAAPKTSGPGAPTVAAGSGTHLEKGYVLRKDPEGFTVAVQQGWTRQPINDAGQVRYVNDGFTMIVVPGRDSVKQYGGDPVAYESDKERELAPFRASSWATASGVRRVDVGEQAMAEGQYTWQDATGATVYVRNLAMIVNGRYDIIQVIGPDSQRDEVSDIYEQAIASYQPNS